MFIHYKFINSIQYTVYSIHELLLDLNQICARDHHLFVHGQVPHHGGDATRDTSDVVTATQLASVDRSLIFHERVSELN